MFLLYFFVKERVYKILLYTHRNYGIYFDKKVNTRWWEKRRNKREKILLFENKFPILSLQ
ncbi:TPA: hypothetical protein DEP21_06520 [Patescibacteria group bacterium]|nr:hypothetical protein [Candidatus Gracilibacteria bacterium]